MVKSWEKRNREGIWRKG
jgi:hypothetical protein